MLLRPAARQGAPPGAYGWPPIREAARRPCSGHYLEGTAQRDLRRPPASPTSNTQSSKSLHIPPLHQPVRGCRRRSFRIAASLASIRRTASQMFVHRSGIVLAHAFHGLDVQVASVAQARRRSTLERQRVVSRRRNLAALPAHFQLAVVSSHANTSAEAQTLRDHHGVRCTSCGQASSCQSTRRRAMQVREGLVRWAGSRMPILRQRD